MILGLIDKNIENYGLISVNKKGEGYIALPFPVTVTLDHDYDEEEKESESVAPMGKGGAADEELFSMLKDLRKKVAKQHNLPPSSCSRTRRWRTWPCSIRSRSKRCRTSRASAWARRASSARSSSA